jgi:hypothetical protein
MKMAIGLLKGMEKSYYPFSFMDDEDYLVSNLTVLLFAERLAKLQSVFIFKLQ